MLYNHISLEPHRVDLIFYLIRFFTQMYGFILVKCRKQFEIKTESERVIFCLYFNKIRKANKYVCIFTSNTKCKCQKNHS